MYVLRRAVGPEMPNDPEDVKTVDHLLDRWAMALHQPLGASATQPAIAQRQQRQRIEAFQHQVLGDPCPSGIVAPGDRTARKLEELPKTAPTHFPVRPPRGPLLMNVPAGTLLSLPPRTDPRVLNDDDYAAAAQEIGCEMLAIKAVSMEEGKGQGFDAMGYPVILFEPLNFATNAGKPSGQEHFRRSYQRNYPNLTYRQPSSHPYGPTNQIWQRLQMAYLLDPQDALKATSWGRFQVKGESALAMGYCSVESFVSAMCRSENEHLGAFIRFISLNNLAAALKEKDWATFAFGYNGSHYKSPQYQVGGKNYAQRIGECYDQLRSQSK